MTRAHCFPAGWHRSHLVLALGAVGLLAISFTAGGCGGEDLAGAGLIASEETLGADFAVDVPALAELNSRLNLSTEQSGKMERILADWRDDAANRMAKHAGRRAGHRAGHKDGHGMARPMDTPGFDHLVDAAAVLNNDQLDNFATYIEERRAARRADQKAHRGTDDASSMRPMAKRLAGHLGVSTEEMKQIGVIHREAAGRMRDLHTGYAEGKLSDEELRDGLRAIRLDTEGRMKSALGEDIFNRLHERRDEMKEKALDRRAENLDRRMARQADRLGRALRLDEAGGARLSSAIEQTEPARRQLIEQMANDGMAPEDVLYQGIQIEKNARTAIRAVLSPDEVVRFDSLRRLLPAGLGVRGAGFGHGGHGSHHGHD